MNMDCTFTGTTKIKFNPQKHMETQLQRRVQAHWFHAFAISTSVSGLFLLVVTILKCHTSIDYIGMLVVSVCMIGLSILLEILLCIKVRQQRRKDRVSLLDI